MELTPLPKTFLESIQKLPRLDVKMATPHGMLRPCPSNVTEVYVLAKFELEGAIWGDEPAALVLNRHYFAVAWVAACNLKELENKLKWAWADHWDGGYAIQYLGGHLCDCDWYDAENSARKQNSCDGCLEMLQDGLCPLYPDCGQKLDFDVQKLLKMEGEQ